MVDQFWQPKVFWLNWDFYREWEEYKGVLTTSLNPVACCVTFLCFVGVAVEIGFFTFLLLSQTFH